MSEQITLPAPPLEFSMEPGEEQPFSQYSIQVDAEGFRPFTVSGIELFSKQLSLQEVRMDEVDAPGNPVDTIVIPVNTLWGDFPPKIAESEIKPISETGEIVLSRVVVPEYVVVHDGPPNDTTGARLLCAIQGLHQKCSVQRNLFHLAGCDAARKYPCNHVIYIKPGVHGVVPEQRHTVSRSPPPPPTTRNLPTAGTFSRASPTSWMKCSRTFYPGQTSASQS